LLRVTDDFLLPNRIHAGFVHNAIGNSVENITAWVAKLVTKKPRFLGGKQ